jgi:hypothetical protein
MKNILLSVTTTTGSDWKKMVADINKLKIKEVALFPTAIADKEREELYQLLENSTIDSIPFVHLRSDMLPSELKYLIKKYKTKVFNIHSEQEFPLFYDYSKHRDVIYIENTPSFLDEEELKEYAGICLDISHLENDRLTCLKRFKQTQKMITKYPIGCNHISALKKEPRLDKNSATFRYDKHHLVDLSELNYLKRYPLSYFSDFIAIELENSIKEQLVVQKYITDLLFEK